MLEEMRDGSIYGMRGEDRDHLADAGPVCLREVESQHLSRGMKGSSTCYFGRAKQWSPSRMKILA